MPGDSYSLAGNPNSQTLKTVAVATNALGGDQLLVSAIPERRIKVYALVLSATLGATLVWKSGTKAISGKFLLPANNTLVLVVPPPNFVLATGPTEDLILTVATPIDVNGWIAYWDDDVV